MRWKGAHGSTCVMKDTSEHMTPKSGLSLDRRDQAPVSETQQAEMSRRSDRARRGEAGRAVAHRSSSPCRVKMGFPADDTMNTCFFRRRHRGSELSSFLRHSHSRHDGQTQRPGWTPARSARTRRQRSVRAPVQPIEHPAPLRHLRRRVRRLLGLLQTSRHLASARTHRTPKMARSTAARARARARAPAPAPRRQGAGSRESRRAPLRPQRAPGGARPRACRCHPRPRRPSLRSPSPPHPLPPPPCRQRPW